MHLYPGQSNSLELWTFLNELSFRRKETRWISRARVSSCSSRPQACLSRSSRRPYIQEEYFSEQRKSTLTEIEWIRRSLCCFQYCFNQAQVAWAQGPAGGRHGQCGQEEAPKGEGEEENFRRWEEEGKDQGIEASVVFVLLIFDILQNKPDFPVTDSFTTMATRL